MELKEVSQHDGVSDERMSQQGIVRSQDYDDGASNGHWRYRMVFPQVKQHRNIFWTSLAFVLGFSLAFTLLGASATSIGKFIFTNKAILTRVAGGLVIILGLHMAGVFRIPILYQEKRLQLTRKPPGMLGAFLIGLAFAVGWTPCIGPFLGATLALAAQKETVAGGMFLLFAFSLGLGIPFLLTGMAINTFLSAFKKFKRYFHVVEWLGGGLLVMIGTLMITGGFTRLAGLASGIPELTLGPSGNSLTLLSAFMAGILAFLSPCVLPLIPGYISYVSGVSLQELQGEDPDNKVKTN